MQNIKEKVAKVFESKMTLGVLYTVGIIIVGLLIFSAGVRVGFHKASFGRAWGENYERNFGMMGPGRPPFGFGRDSYPNAHGATGKIIKTELPNIIVQDKDNTEKVVLIKDDTVIQQMMQNIKASDLAVDQYIVVIGSPNDKGQIEAKFIRVMPFGAPLPPPQNN